MKEVVAAEINILVDQRIRVPTEQIDWLSPVVLAWKKNGPVRVCCAFRILNKSIISDKFRYLVRETVCSATYKEHAVSQASFRIGVPSDTASLNM